MTPGKTAPGLRDIFEDAPIGVALIGPDRRYLRANRAPCEWLGYPERELVGKSLSETIHPEDRRRSAERVERLLSDEPGRNSLEERYLGKDGRVVWVLSSASPIRDAQREPGRFVICFQGIIGRKRLEEELRRGEERFRSLIRNAPDLITMLEADGTVRYDSPAIRYMLGYEPEERIGKNAFDYIHPEDAGRARRTFGETATEPLAGVGWNYASGAETVPGAASKPPATTFWKTHLYGA